MDVLMLGLRWVGRKSLEHRSIIAQDPQELHSGCEGGCDICGEDCLVGVVTEAAGTPQEQHCGRNAAGDNHRVVAGTAGDFAGMFACSTGTRVTK
jgi:hypothetical protein